jgi:hypothetical protein
MEGCSAPLVVKFADTQKEKDAKRVQAIHSNLWNFAATMQTPQMTATSPISLSSPAVHPTLSCNSSPYLASDALPAANQLQILQQLSAIGLQQQLLQGKI